jgi:hypothetical protein
MTQMMTNGSRTAIFYFEYKFFRFTPFDKSLFFGRFFPNLMPEVFIPMTHWKIWTTQTGANGVKLRPRS